jgi:hypothetical protein
MVTLQPSISTHKPASTLKVEELEEETHSGEGQTEMRKRDCAVRQFFSLSLCTELSVADVYMDANRQVQFCLPSRAYSMEGPARSYARQTSLTPSPSKTGDYFNLTFMSVVLLPSVHAPL